MGSTKPEPTAFLSRVLDTASQALASSPPSVEADRLAHEVDALRVQVKSWRQSPPVPAKQDQVVEKVLALHSEVMRCARAIREEDGTREPDPRDDPASEPPGVNDNERVTVPPTFNMEAFAREMAGRDTEPPPTKRKPRSLTPSGIEQAVVAAVEDPRAPMLSQHEIEDPAEFVLARYRAHDFEGALAMAEVILAEAPDSAVVREIRANCREALTEQYAKALGGLDQVPVVLADDPAAECVLVDHRATFLASLIDGLVTVAEVVEASGMPPYDALRILRELAKRRIVAFG